MKKRFFVHIAEVKKLGEKEFDAATSSMFAERVANGFNVRHSHQKFLPKN